MHNNEINNDGQSGETGSPVSAMNLGNWYGFSQKPKDSAQIAIKIITEKAQFWHDSKQNAYATFDNTNVPLRESRFKQWCHNVFYQFTGELIADSVIEGKILPLLEHKARAGTQYDVAVRVAQVGERVYIDASPGKTIEVSAAGWQIMPGQPPVKFLRFKDMKNLPEPVKDGNIEELFQILNVQDKDDRTLVIGWLLGTLSTAWSMPILIVEGPQGSAKTTLCKILKNTIDPSANNCRSIPRNEWDLAIHAEQSWIQDFDNLSGVPPWFSDCLCRLSTGGTFTARCLYTGREQEAFNFKRPVIQNGINAKGRADLLDWIEESCSTFNL